jgi:hypothetical protein
MMFTDHITPATASPHSFNWIHLCVCYSAVKCMTLDAQLNPVTILGLQASGNLVCTSLPPTITIPIAIIYPPSLHLRW